MPAGSGQGKVAVAVYRLAIEGRGTGRATVRMRSGARLDLDLEDRIQAWAFLTRDYEPPLIRFLARRLHEGGIFFDVGAHVGVVSFTLAARCPPLEVHAFEPDPHNATDFRRNHELNPGLNVTLNELALSGRTGQVLLQRSSVSSERGTGKVTGEGSPAGPDSSDALRISATTLDDYIAERGVLHIDVLKIDVEGLEPAVLAGCERHLGANRIGCVVCEVNDPLLRENGWSRESLNAIMSGHGYKPVPLPNVGLRRLIPRKPHEVDDVVFIPRAS